MIADDKGQIFRDWIPAGEDTGAIGNNGFQDYVPAKEPVQEPEAPKPTEEEQQDALTPDQPVEEPYVAPPLEPVTNQDIKEQAQGQSLVDKLNPFKKEEGGQQ